MVVNLGDGDDGYLWCGIGVILLLRAFSKMRDVFRLFTKAFVSAMIMF